MRTRAKTARAAWRAVRVGSHGCLRHGDVQAHPLAAGMGFHAPGSAGRGSKTPSLSWEGGRAAAGGASKSLARIFHRGCVFGARFMGESHFCAPSRSTVKRPWHPGFPWRRGASREARKVVFSRSRAERGSGWRWPCLGVRVAHARDALPPPILAFPRQAEEGIHPFYFNSGRMSAPYDEMPRSTAIVGP
jgi:hypothetical protein